MKKLDAVSFDKVSISDGFWSDRIDRNKNVTVFSVRDRFKATGRFEAFRFNWTEGSDIPKPHYFWDSDVAKWIESVAYILKDEPQHELRKEAEELIELMEKNQCEDGYFNIYHTVVAPQLRFKNRDNHELYCLGHFIEAAVAFFEATGDGRLLEITDRYIDLVIKVFCEEKSADFVTPGHEEIELALIRLYRLKKDKKYLELARFFIDQRGQKEEQLCDWYNSSYNQSHLPVRQQKEVMGHSVRACYLYSAMADLAKETDDEELLEACRALFDDITERKMYITGGVGSSCHGEAFTVKYDLPNDTAYAETCASIALMMFADRMKDIDLDSRYGDIVEKTIYNGIISGISLDGRSFFYENPLEINIADHSRHTSLVRHGERLPITKRKEVFDCSCCPPNMTRFLASVGGHIFSCNEKDIFVHQFIPCNAQINGSFVNIETEYPKNGKVRISIKDAEGKRLFVRKPAWCRNFSISSDYEKINGYAVIGVTGDDFEIELDFKMEVRFIKCSELVRANEGKCAVMCGPVVYCMEKTDNDFEHYEIQLDTASDPQICFSEYFNANVIRLNAFRNKIDCGLYSDISDFEKEAVEVRLIPYFGFANRGDSSMAVWLRY